MRELFGTDGVRGVANVEPMTPEIAYNLGRSAGYVLRELGRDTVLVGRDSRISGDMLECALVAGLCAVGTSVCRAGIVPTPAVAHLTGALSAHAGVMISASHNAMPHNGIKFFSVDGTKLDDRLEERIESVYAEQTHRALRPTGAEIGRVVDRRNVVERYLKFVHQTVPPEFDLSGLTIAVDCANGATSFTTPVILQRLGAEVVAINCVPDGLNINAECGSQDLGPLREAVARHLADVGIAHDGDGDRAVLVDERSSVLNGDHILMICARHMKAEGRLLGDTIVTTLLGNTGLDLTLAADGIRVERSKVGDRFVWEKMRELGAPLGGEQAGHVIFSEFTCTGDGLVTALQVLRAMLTAGRPLSELAAQLQALPQATRDIPVASKPPLQELPLVRQALKAAEVAIAGRGRVVFRYSGTEPLARVMVETEDAGEAEHLAQQVADAIRASVPEA